ncbi:hypothetical protein EVAR_77792_1 [Eumeta japonica]|uniref:Uncharacterized protein n=1 Tax=Eumeta variegata TaxID=151549 RepID=A0A4C1TEF0_EUMVA|nr:hypothetical protein EVAR_77792_1 [Eumeta japonica]
MRRQLSKRGPLLPTARVSSVSSFPGCAHGSRMCRWECACEKGWDGMCDEKLNYCKGNRETCKMEANVNLWKPEMAIMSASVLLGPAGRTARYYQTI